MDDIILEETRVKSGRVEFNYELRGKLSHYFTTKCMYVEYGQEIGNVPKSILNISFVASVLPLMWLTDTVLWVDEIDRTFYDCVIRLKNAYQELYPQYPLKGRFVAAKTVYNSYEIKRECLLLFSGGIDAHVSYLRNREYKPVLCNIQGWYDDPDKTKIAAANADYKDIKAFARKEDVKFEYVKSNFATLVNNYEFKKNIQTKLGDSWWHGFQHSMSFISIAMPLAYIYGAKNIYIASSFAIGNPGKCASYATTDIEFKFATDGGCIHDAFDMSRQKKVQYLVEYQKKSGKPYPVRVCSFNDKNCCECEKCFRTILEIVAEGGDIHNFGFEIESSLKEHWENVFERKLYGFGVEGEKKKHWPDSIKRMKENYAKIEEKEFVDWFLNYDFIGERKKAVRKYYRDNFGSILKRKIVEYREKEILNNDGDTE